MKSVFFGTIFFVTWMNFGLVLGEKKYGKFNGKFKDREPQRSNKMRRMLQRRQMKCKTLFQSDFRILEKLRLNFEAATLSIT